MTHSDVLKQVGGYAHAGGQILFGTDAGYIPDYDPTAEYALMARSGLSFSEVLASLTTAPAERFGETNLRGGIEPGMLADIVVLADDPGLNVRSLSNVQYTIRGGKIIYASHPAVVDSESAANLMRFLIAALLIASVWYFLRRFLSKQKGKATV